MNSKRILIVDDEVGITRSLKLNLEATAGYDVRTVNASTRAMDAALAFHPQLILMAVLMPDLDLCEVSARIHADPELADTPIVFLTALASNETTGGHAAAAGSTVYFVKPVDTAKLIKCIKETLSPATKPQCHAFLYHP